MSAHDAAGRLADDDAARERALDTGRSFLVQAPAGSGKTELLIQRLLALLGTVDRPERVVAITFTRKAAGEMRDRVVRALVEAGTAGVDERAMAPHARRTRALARAALEQDRRHGWHLVLHPARLAIHTIDAFAQSIALRAPLASGLPPTPRFTEDASPLHEAAAHAAIAAAAADDPRWQRLLGHLDNDAAALADAIAALLARRDQWITLLQVEHGDVRAALERTLAEEVAGEFAQGARALARIDPSSLVRLAAAALPHLGADDDMLRALLEASIDRGGPPTLHSSCIDDWRTLASWVSIKDGSALRKAPTGMPGVPAVGDGPGKGERSAHARSFKDWLAELRSAEGVEGALVALRTLPPTRYSDAEWSGIESLLALLPSFAEHLAAVFANEGRVDFAEGTIAALRALGDGDNPGDLLLRLDYAIQHLLVDEFQDTSYAHLELIRRILAGWAAGDGRTLFAVGDPMQSIYRFRGAEVRAFVEAQSAGAIEGGAVELLTLRRNFRSRAGLVDWVNARFPSALGDTDDPWRGRVAFADAVAVRPALDGLACTLDVAASADEEAAMVVARAREALAAGGSIALLVRARGHLARLLPALREASIPCAAVDLDLLADRPAVRDVVSLALALVQPDDRLAWLALLRAPWCGLRLADLHALVRAADTPPARSIEDVALDPPALSPEGTVRLALVSAVVAGSRATRGTAPLVERLRSAWLALGGPATIDEKIDLAAIDEVFALVAEHGRAGDLRDRQAFAAALAQRKLAPPAQDRGGVQVMTMHKAKGLEFDTVILPGLARGRSRNDAPMLRWRTRRAGLMVGLGKARGGDDEGVYAYLKRLEAAEERAELARLAYVASTRARERLALVAAPRPRDDGTWSDASPASILGLFDPSLLEDAPPPGGTPSDAIVASVPSLLERLPAEWPRPGLPPPLALEALATTIEAIPPFDWARERARRLGVVVHALFARIDDDGLGAFDAAGLEARRAFVETALVAEGALPADARAEGEAVRATVAATLDDARGRWIFDTAHADRRVEWALAGIDDGAIVHITLDRTFIANGERWIVDFKTGTHEGGDAARFLDAEAERYAPQLRRYARIVEALDPAHPVRIALYHPRVAGGWRELAR